MAGHLFDCWNDVTARVARGGRVLLWLDFDGTLVPLGDDPEEVVLSRGTRRALVRLVRHRQVTAGIISGRRRDDLIGHVGVRGVRYWGSFGSERRGRYALPARARRKVAQAREGLIGALAGLPGVWLEDKGIAITVHVRGVEPHVKRTARARLGRIVARSGPGLHVMQGTDTWNVLPSEVAGKGAAVRDAVRRARTPLVPIYLGDDATDEPAFEALARGVTVRVGAARPTKARYRLANPDEVRCFIERLESELS